MIQNWPSSPFQMVPPPFHSAAAAQHHSWADEFLDFSSVRRNAHRRSGSDPISFVEAQIFGHDNQECTNNANSTIIQCDNGNEGFEGLDDEQLKTMFSDDVPASGDYGGGPPPSSAPSTPSEENGKNHEKVAPPPEGNLQPKSEPGEDDNSPCKPVMNFTANPSADSIVDPKRIKRILANRQSAQRSRVRKLQYISELERSVTTLQTEVSALSPRVAFLDHQRLILNVDNSALKQRIAALVQDKIFKDAHQEALRKEIERLRQIYHEQNMKKLVANDQATNEAPQLHKGPTPNFTKNVMGQE